jgi:ferredoxin-NADP reductase
MLPNKCHSEVIAVLDLTHDVKEIHLKLINPPYLDFTAGQYITIEVTEMKADIATGVLTPHLKNRPYSIVSSPKERSEIRLCTNRVGQGPGSSRLHALKPGDKLEYCVPMSYFQIHEEDPSSLMFVATGTGIGPLKSMIQYLLQTGSTRPILLYWGLRNEADTYYQEELKAWSYAYPHFQYVTTLSQPSSTWQGLRGRVTEHIRGMEKVDDLSVYLCGNGEMIREVRDILLSKGMDKKSIHFEKFF